ncbi:MAG: PAS domain-containing protein, partial [Desulfoprunum sp.]|nr:PAS domain-containing protein [Desulfoprunum sp.]
SIAVKKGNSDLLTEINTALRIIKADGTYQKILDNWKPKEALFYSREQITNMILTAAIFALLILILIAVLWMVTLKKELTQKKAAEEKLREQYSTLRSIIDSANALIFSVDRQYRYTSFNLGHAAAIKALYGAEIEQGQSLLEYMTVPEDREIAKRNIDRTLTGEQLVEEAYSGEELRTRHYFHVSHSPIKTKKEQIIGVAVLAQDITARKLAEDSLRRLNRELRAITNCNQVLIRSEDEKTLLNDICRIICDEAGYCMAWAGYAEYDDAKTVRPVAWAGNEVGYLADANITWTDTERGRGPTGTAIRSGESTCIQDFVTDPQAAPWRENALLRGYRSNLALPLKDESAKAFGALTIYSMEPNAFTTDEIHLLERLAEDLAFGIMVLRTRTEHRHTKDTLYEAQQVFRTLIENSPDIIARYDRDCRRTYVNPTYLKVAQISHHELIATAPLQRSPLPAASAAVLQNLLCRVLDSGLVEAVDIIWPKKGNIDHWYNIYAFPEVDREGRVVSVMTVSRDITDRKRAEEELNRLNAELEQRVKQRTAELEQKNAELDKMNKLFVGRELRMVELKECIRELERSSGEKGDGDGRQ